jgi:hypothetical protein
VIGNQFLDVLTETLDPDVEVFNLLIEGVDGDCIVIPAVPDFLAEAQTPEEALAKLRKTGWSTAGRSLGRIQNNIDPRFIHHQEHLQKLINGGTRPNGEPFPGGGGLRWGGLEISGQNALLRVMGSFEYKNKQEIYQQIIHFSNLDKILKARGVSWVDKARMLMKDRLKIHCDCPAYRYFHAHAATKKGFALYPELRPANVNNPENKGGICKHLHLTLQYLPAQSSQIAKELKAWAEARRAKRQKP